jgi:hypothetical protein
MVLGLSGHKFALRRQRLIRPSVLEANTKSAFRRLQASQIQGGRNRFGEVEIHRNPRLSVRA